VEESQVRKVIGLMNGEEHAANLKELKIEN
jgi:hypothetical protein